MLLSSTFAAVVTAGPAVAATVVPSVAMSQCNNDPAYDASNDPNTCDAKADKYFHDGGPYSHW